MLDAAAGAYFTMDILLECWMLQQTHISEWIYCLNVGCRSRRIFQNGYTAGMLDAAAGAYFRMNILLECWMLNMLTHPIVLVGSDAVWNRPPYECVLPDTARRAVPSFMYNLHNGYWQENVIIVSTSVDGFYTNMYKNQTSCTMYCEMTYVRCHFWTPICNVLGYWRHRSVCYTPLFTTPLVVTTVSGYNVLWPSDVVSRSGPLISSPLSVPWSPSVISHQCLYLGVSSISLFFLCLFSLYLCLCMSLIFLCLSSLCLSPLKSSVCARNRRHIVSRLHLPLFRFRNNFVV
jgi:hypothetical protein